MNIYASNTRTLSGEATSLSRFSGQVTLIVNVASECGYTPQYAGLERLQQRYKGKGFSVLGFPSNDFGAQEPGSAEQIQAFCTTRYGASFPMFEKVSTKPGPEQSPVYAALGEAAGALPKWNFSKYLVARNGQVIAFYPSSVEPEDPKLLAAIDEALAAAP